MKKRIAILLSIVVLLITACASEQAGPEVTVFRTPS
jgi:hypothetical protein